MLSRKSTTRNSCFERKVLWPISLSALLLQINMIKRDEYKRERGVSVTEIDKLKCRKEGLCIDGQYMVAIEVDVLQLEPILQGERERDTSVPGLHVLEGGKEIQQTDGLNVIVAEVKVLKLKYALQGERDRERDRKKERETEKEKQRETEKK